MLGQSASQPFSAKLCLTSPNTTYLACGKDGLSRSSPCVAAVKEPPVNYYSPASISRLRNKKGIAEIRPRLVGGVEVHFLARLGPFHQQDER